MPERLDLGNMLAVIHFLQDLEPLYEVIYKFMRTD